MRSTQTAELAAEKSHSDWVTVHRSFADNQRYGTGFCKLCSLQILVKLDVSVYYSHNHSTMSFWCLKNISFIFGPLAPSGLAALFKSVKTLPLHMSNNCFFFFLPMQQSTHHRVWTLWMYWFKKLDYCYSISIYVELFKYFKLLIGMGRTQMTQQ